MKSSFKRYGLIILVTGALTLLFAMWVLGMPSVKAQTPPAESGQRMDLEPVVVAQADGSAAPAPAAPAPAPAAPAPAAGSAAPAAPAAGGAPPPAAAPKVLEWYEELANKPIDEEGNFWMPKSVNLEADSTDSMFYAVYALSVVFFVAITIAVVYFTIKYRHRPGHKPEPSPAHHDALEITWTIIPTIMVVFLFYYGWRTYIKVVTPPTKAVEINVVASQWHWKFYHQGGLRADNDLHVPVDTPVRLVMTSEDVIHAFYAPVMRVKQDIIPKRYTYAWFYPTKPGTYRLTCAEYCGTDHSQMSLTPGADGKTMRRAVVVVHKRGDYERYLEALASQNVTVASAENGLKVYTKKGCVACHTTDGTARVGPTFAHSFGTMVPTDEAGQVKMDENYIRESVLSPAAKTHSGFPKGQMPSFEGQLKDIEIQSIIEMIKSLK